MNIISFSREELNTMIYLCTALYFEANPFIKNFQLKRNSNLTRFAVYNNDKICLIITGTGANAAIGLTYLLSNITITSEDVLINVGVCGSTSKDQAIGSPYLINKIKDHSTNLTYFPEMLYKHPFLESSIESCPTIINTTQIHTLTEPLIDMEASYIYQAASYFIKPHQLFIFKIISDHLEGYRISKDEIEKLISPQIIPLIEWVNMLASTILVHNKIFSVEETKLYEEVVSKLRLSATMQAKLKQLLLYAKSCDKPISSIMDDFQQNNDIADLKVKTEGKRYFELLLSKLI